MVGDFDRAAQARTHSTEDHGAVYVFVGEQPTGQPKCAHAMSKRRHMAAIRDMWGASQR